MMSKGWFTDQSLLFAPFPEPRFTFSHDHEGDLSAIHILQVIKLVQLGQRIATLHPVIQPTLTDIQVTSELTMCAAAPQ